MPQQIPFYFVNQATIIVVIVSIITITFSVYVIPPLLQLWVTRLYITKL